MANKLRANKGSGNVEARDNWETPQKLFDKLNKQYDFDTDCCASKDNKKCVYWTDDFQNYRPSKYYDYICWMNPPFSKAKEMFKRFFSFVDYGVAIYRCDNMETKIWQEIILENADWVFIPKKRINYEGKKGNGAVFPSALIGFGVKPIKDIEGTTLFAIRSDGGQKHGE